MEDRRENTQDSQIIARDYAAVIITDDWDHANDFEVMLKVYDIPAILQEQEQPKPKPPNGKIQVPQIEPNGDNPRTPPRTQIPKDILNGTIKEFRTSSDKP